MSKEINLRPVQVAAVLLTRDGLPLSPAQKIAMGQVSAEVDQNNVSWKKVFALADEKATSFGRAVLDHYLEE